MKYIYIAAFIAIALAGCAKPEDGPLERITEQYAFDPKDPRGTLAEQFLNDIYSILPDGFNRIDGNFLDAATDDAIPMERGTQIDVLSKGFLSVSNNPDDAWGKNYEGIRKTNIYLQKIDIVPIPEAQKAMRKAEARALRALFYFELVKRYGGVPLLEDEVLNAEDPKNFTRNTFEECINYIVSECDDLNVINKVGADPLSSNDYGRMSKAVVLAIKARTLLYAASPLYNGGNIGAGSARLLQGYDSFDKERWNKAMLAAEAVKNQTSFGLLPANTFATNEVFLKRRNKEVIFAYLRSDSKDLETNNGPVGYAYPNLSNGRTNPTQDLVEAFPDKDGRAISESASYNPQNPYSNRDPRLTRTVMVNGENWLKRPVETFEGGKDKPNNTSRQTRTGYYLRKFLGNFGSSDNYGNTPHNYPIFRYADILLAYAEARNEYLDAPDTEVYKVLYDLRLRAGIPVGSVAGFKHGLKSTMTKTEMREAIQNERRLELAFEEHRYWDVRRWKIAEFQFNQTLEGMKITKGSSGTLGYEKVNVDKIIFTNPRMYFYPIPNNEILKNSNLIQNTGW